MKAEVFPANLRDLSYVASNLRPHDRHEIDCQCAWWSPALLAHGAIRGFAYVVWLDHNPEAAFGAAEERPGLWHAWSWGGVRMHRCVPAITRHFYSTLGPAVAEAGAWRVEARALASNELALRWLRKLSAVERCVLPRYGKNGEDFILFDWTRESWSQAFESDKVKRLGGVLETPAPSLSPDLVGGQHDEANSTAPSLPNPVF